jgi:integrase
MKDLLSKEKDIIEYLEKEYKTTSTLKNKLCGIYKCYTLLNIESTLLKDKIESYNITQAIIEDKKNQEEKKPIEEADKVLEYFKDKLKEMEQSLKHWDTKTQLYCILKIYLGYGVLRPSEIIDMKILDEDEGNENINYINIRTKKIIINKHKNDKNGPKIIDIKCKKLLSQLLKGYNKYLICNSKCEKYNDTSAFTKLFSRTFDKYTPYDLRKCISSKDIHEGNPENIKML